MSNARAKALLSLIKPTVLSCSLSGIVVVSDWIVNVREEFLSLMLLSLAILELQEHAKIRRKKNDRIWKRFGQVTKYIIFFRKIHENEI